ncbi:MAG TPA: type II secretion system F family protein [Gaiellaceae bacterium]|nr:type II secretion system F family protein [Gaiellaceae bacterium]
MTGMLLIGILLVAAATGLAVRAATMRRAQTAKAISRFGAYGYPVEEPQLEQRRGGPLSRALEHPAGSLGRGLRHALLGASEDDVRALLRGAGLYRATPTGYALIRLLALGAGTLVAAWLWLGGLAPLLALPLGLLLLAGAWLLPPAELKRRRAVRLARIDRGLADLVDFLVVTIEAGIGFGSALNAAARRFRAPLGDELRLTVQEQSMGLSTEEALRNFLGRCETPMVRSFVRSILQAETLGVSIGQILRSLAVEMRKRRRQAAEEQAHKAPVKIVFPLAFLILPAMFLILLGPAVYSLMQGFGG